MKVFGLMIPALAIGTLSGCSSGPAPTGGPPSQPAAASMAQPAAPAAPPVPAAPYPGMFSEASDQSIILRIVPDPANLRMWLLARSPDGTYRPFMPGNGLVGEDTVMPDALIHDTAVLYAQAPGYTPWAIEFVPNLLADLFPRLRREPEAGTTRALNENEELAVEVRRELARQFGPEATPKF